MLVGNERNVFRKIREAILAHKIEQRLKKEQILAIYLNHVYLGHGAYGVQAAAEVYFGKDAKDLTIAEAAMLGGLPKAPTEDSPYGDFKRARIASATCSARCSTTSSSPTRSIKRRAARVDRHHLQGHAAQPRRGALLRRARAARSCRPSTPAATSTIAACASTPRSTCASSAPPRPRCATGSTPSTTASASAGRSAHLDDAKLRRVPRRRCRRRTSGRSRIRCWRSRPPASSCPTRSTWPRSSARARRPTRASAPCA